MTAGRRRCPEHATAADTTNCGVCTRAPRLEDLSSRHRPLMLRNAVVAEDLARVVNAPFAWERLQNRTVLVSGAAGFLPAYMVETLVMLNERDPAFGPQVVGLVRSAERAATRCGLLRPQ